MGGEGPDARRTREYYRVNPEGGFTYVGPQSEVMNLLDPTQTEEFMKNMLGMRRTDSGNCSNPGGSLALDKQLLAQSQAFGEEVARDPAYRSAIRQMRQDEARKGNVLELSPEELGQFYAQTFIKPNPAAEAGKQFAGGRAPIQAKRGVRVINGYGN